MGGGRKGFKMSKNQKNCPHGLWMNPLNDEKHDDIYTSRNDMTDLFNNHWYVI